LHYQRVSGGESSIAAERLITTGDSDFFSPEPWWWLVLEVSV
jgi:hypothetical protein